MRELHDTDSEGSKRDQSESSQRTVAVTHNGKNELVIFLNKRGKYEIKFWNGGVIPDLLKGEYTSYIIAEERIKLYMAVTSPKVKVTKGTK